MKMTDRWIERLKPTGKREKYWDETSYGGGSFGIRMNPSGKKTWILRVYNKSTRKEKWFTLGDYPDMSLTKAREKAREVSANGFAEERTVDDNTLKETVDIDALSRLYMEKWAKIRKRTWQEDLRMLEHDILPAIGKKPVDSIQKADIIHILDIILDRGAQIQANRTCALLKTMFAFAKDRGLTDRNPAEDVSRPALERKRDRILDDAELAVFFNALFGPTPVSVEKELSFSILFHLATASRSGETRSVEWADIKDDVWILPKEKSKNNMGRKLPLTKLTTRLLELQKEAARSPYVFVSPRTGSPYYPTSENHALKRISSAAGIQRFSAHDLRRTAASQLSMLGVSREVLKKILNHVDNDVTAIYDRHTYEQEKREALELWNEKIIQIIHSVAPDCFLFQSEQECAITIQL